MDLLQGYNSASSEDADDAAHDYRAKPVARRADRRFLNPAPTPSILGRSICHSPDGPQVSRAQWKEGGRSSCAHE